MHKAAHIQYLLKLREKTQRDVAEKLGVDPSTISQVINGRRRSKRIEIALAKMLGYSREALFGEAIT